MMNCYMNDFRMKFCLTLIIALLTQACGSVNFVEESGKEDDQPETLLTETDPRLRFTGYINSAFEVIVDGEEYADMEDFYTQELDRLPEKVANAGYGEDWDVRLDAELGLSDLWNNMKVFIAPQSGVGHQALTRVRQGGEFSVSFPNDGLDTDYRIRAVKRINVILTSETESKIICYNFSAHEENVPFHDEAHPVVLKDFSTRLTAYDCSLSDDKLDIPQREEL